MMQNVMEAVIVTADDMSALRGRDSKQVTVSCPQHCKMDGRNAQATKAAAVPVSRLRHRVP